MSTPLLDLDLVVVVSKRKAATKGAVERTPFARGMASALAREVRARVATRGDTVQPFESFSTRGEGSTYANGAPRLGFRVSPAYPAAAGGKPTRSGALAFSSSAAFHRSAGALAGRFNVTGGMWRGLGLLMRGENGAAIVFLGRSQGANPNDATAKQRERRGLGGAAGRKTEAAISRRLARGRQIPNALKAASLRQSINVNVLSVKSEEVGSMSAAATELVRQGVDAELPIAVDWDRPSSLGGSRGFVSRIVRAVQTNKGLT